MQSSAITVQDYLDTLPDERREAMANLRKTINEHIPDGFKECMNYGMIGWVVPHSTFPQGYHCDPKLPLPFLSIASQKNFVALYHMGVYADKDMLDWFVSEYPKHSKTKLDMGKSCIRFKKPEQIPFQLIAELVSKMTPEAWIALYKSNLQR